MERVEDERRTVYTAGNVKKGKGMEKETEEGGKSYATRGRKRKMR